MSKRREIRIYPDGQVHICHGYVGQALDNSLIFLCIQKFTPCKTSLARLPGAAERTGLRRVAVYKTAEVWSELDYVQEG